MANAITIEIAAPTKAAEDAIQNFAAKVNAWLGSLASEFAPNLTEITVKAAKAFEQIDEAYAKSTKSRLALLKDEYESRVSKLTSETELSGRQLKILERVRDLEKETFTGRMQAQLTELYNNWSNLGGNLAANILGGIERAVNGVSEAIMGAITGTRTWGQVFAQIGRQIIANLISMVVQWIASMTILAAIRKLFHAESVSEAGGITAAWAVPAALISIATKGAAVVAGMTAYTVGLAAAQGIAAGMSAAGGAAGYAEGGLTPGGPSLIQVGERGPEFVIRNAALRRFGADFFERLNAGVLDLYALANASPGLRSPDYGAMAAVARPGSVTVQGHKAYVGVFDSRRSAEEWARSRDARAWFIDLARKTKNEIGIPS